LSHFAVDEAGGSGVPPMLWPSVAAVKHCGALLGRATLESCGALTGWLLLVFTTAAAGLFK
jgi:hypothetical protein